MNQISPAWPLLPDPQTAARSQMADFAAFCAAREGQSLDSPQALHDFSVRDFRAFWRHFLAWSRIEAGGAVEPVCTDDRCEHAVFFPGLSLSYADSVLRVGSAQEGARPAVTCVHASGAVETLTRSELRRQVAATAAGLAARGVGPADRVVAVAYNNAGPVVGALAAAAVGAAFASASPEMGTQAILSRFRQLSPRVLMAHLGGEGPAGAEAQARRIAEVARGLPSLSLLVGLDDGPFPDLAGVAMVRLADLAAGPGAEGFAFARLPFNHPLFILFSSGTTGAPKCIEHGAGGTLLEHLKEHRLHTDLGPGDRMFFHTSTAWMMWNWQLSALASGAGIVLYDGPVAGPETLWRIVAEQGVTVFGTSPPYLKLCQEAGYSPRAGLALPELRAVLSTGSVLHDTLYDWVAAQVGRVPLQSISGGTDIVGCFVLGNPMLPVRRGESQCRSLGMDVQAQKLEEADGGAEPSGTATATAEPGGTARAEPGMGELVCRNPFPSRPLGFFGDAGGTLFHNAYFARNPGVWTHGDLVTFSDAGGARLHGRADSVMNINGVRIGPAEIYQVVSGFAEVREAMAVEQPVPGNAGEGRLVLLLVMAPGHALDTALRARLRRALAAQASPLHVPARIVAVPELPVTHSGKRSERAARDALGGKAGGQGGALANPGALPAIRALVAAEDQALRALGAEAQADRAATLRAIWERSLGLPGIGADENFFDLGGTSLVAMRLCQEVNERLGLAIGPWILLQAPTLGALVRALAEGAPDGPDALPPIVQVRDGPGEPVFLVPGMYGDIMELRALLARLDCGRPLYGLRARGLAPGETPHLSVQAAAEDYIASIRRVQPGGPYTLVGFSFGGLVAYEIACRLREAGETVAFLGLIDTDVHDSCLTPGARLAFLATRPFRYARLAATSPHGPAMLMHRFLRTRSTRQVRGDAPVMPPLLLRLGRSSRRAFRRFHPRPLAGVAVAVFRAAQRWPRFCDPLPVWRRCIGGEIAVREIPGAHTDLVNEPSVGVLAAALAAFLAGAAQSGEAAAPGGAQPRLPHGSEAAELAD